MAVSDRKPMSGRSSATVSSNTGPSSASATNIKVIARFRPLNSDELTVGEASAEPIVGFLSEESCSIESRDFSGSFTFDRVFDMESQQEDVFNYSFKQTVDDLMKGYNGTVFAYGQTGSGKSYTMMGPNNNIDDPVLRGMIPRIVDSIFQMILDSSADIEYTVKVSYMEIYMERIRDLLNPTNVNLHIHEDKARGVYVKGLTEEYVSSSEEVYDVMRQGSSFRAVASTNMNQESSRSHSIFVITVGQKNTISGAQKVGQLSLVDLAGSEKVGKTGASGQTLEEAKKINKSLSALGMVINSLTDGKSTHIPYRDSKLTRILQESLGGNSRTSLIVNCSPSAFNDSETLSSLRFGVRAKNIKNKAKINTELSSLELRQLLGKCQNQLESRIIYSEKLEEEIKAWRSGDPPAKDTWVALGGPPTSSLLADNMRGSSYSPSNPTSTSSTAPPSRTASTVSVKSVVQSSFRKNSGTLPTSIPLKKNSVSEASSSAVDGLEASKLASVQPDDSDDSSKQNTSGEVDTIEEYMRRENELCDQISEKESVINKQEQLLLSLRSQMATMAQQNQQQTVQHQSQKKASGELVKVNTELKLQVDNLNYEMKELSITADTLNEENKKLSQELQEVKRQLLESELSNKSFSTVSAGAGSRSRRLTSSDTGISNGSGNVLSAANYGEEKRLGNSVMASPSKNSDTYAGTDINSSSTEGLKIQNSSSIKAASEEEEFNNDDNLTEEAIHEKKKREKMNEILGQFYQSTPSEDFNKLFVGKTESKDAYAYFDGLLEKQHESFQKYVAEIQGSDKAKIEVEKIYEAKLKSSEELTRKLLLEINELKNEKQAVKLQKSSDTKDDPAESEDKTEADISSAAKDKEEQAAAAREQIEKMQEHIEQFESLKSSLMKDLQERCERVVELEISLEQAREQYNLAIQNSNNKQQQKKMTLLQRNLEQLSTIQRQLVEQNVSLKRNAAMSHKILDSRNDRIQSLEAALRDSQNKLSQESEIFETKLSYLRDRLLEVKRGGNNSMLSNGSFSSSAFYASQDQRTLDLLPLDQSASFNSPPDSPTISLSTMAYSPEHKTHDYPEYLKTSPTRRNVSRTVSGGPNSKIVKPLRGGGAGSGTLTAATHGNDNNKSSNKPAFTAQKINHLADSDTERWTKLNSAEGNGTSNDKTYARSPTRPLSPIKLKRDSESKNTVTKNSQLNN